MTSDIDNKKWQQTRQHIWQTDIEPELEDTQLFLNRKTMKMFAHYYLTGEGPKWLDRKDYDDPIPLLIRLWLHPDQSENNWQRIYDDFFDDDWEIADVKDNLLLSMEVLSKAHSNFRDYPQGSFKGLEPRLLSFFYELIQQKIQPRDNALASELMSKGLRLSSFVGRSKRWLLTPILLNQNFSSRFLVEAWSQTLRNTDEYERLEHKQFAVSFLYIVSHYPIEGVEGDPIRCEFAKKVCDKLDTTSLPTFLSKWWAVAKSATSEQEAIELATPFFTPEPVPPKLEPYPPENETPKERMLRLKAERDARIAAKNAPKKKSLVQQLRDMK